MPKVFTSKTQKIGELGEEIACKYLKNKGFDIIERNYTIKLGEIDIVAKKEGTTHFIEVKAVSTTLIGLGSQEKLGQIYRPEENMHPKKVERFYRAIEIYMSERGTPDRWQADLLCVFIDSETKKAKVSVYENI